jgi:hypothetical protein
MRLKDIHNQCSIYMMTTNPCMYILDVRRYKLSTASRGFRVAAPIIWNALHILTLDPSILCLFSPTFENILFRVCLRPLANFSAHQIQLARHLGIKSGILSIE